MSITHIGRSVAAICSAKNTTAQEIAARAGLSHVVLSRAANGTRMESKTLRALVSSQPDRRDGLDLLVGHLRDEVERAGATGFDVIIQRDGREVSAELRLLAEECEVDHHLRELLHEMAAIVKSRPLVTYQQPEEDSRLVAEDPPKS